jgi:hypothetical protein
MTRERAFSKTLTGAISMAIIDEGWDYMIDPVEMEANVLWAMAERVDWEEVCKFVRDMHLSMMRAGVGPYAKVKEPGNADVGAKEKQ